MSSNAHESRCNRPQVIMDHNKGHPNIIERQKIISLFCLNGFCDDRKVMDVWENSGRLVEVLTAWCTQTARQGHFSCRPTQLEEFEFLGQICGGWVSYCWSQPKQQFYLIQAGSARVNGLFQNGSPVDLNLNKTC